MSQFDPVTLCVPKRNILSCIIVSICKHVLVVINPGKQIYPNGSTHSKNRLVETTNKLVDIYWIGYLFNQCDWLETYN